MITGIVMMANTANAKANISETVIFGSIKNNNADVPRITISDAIMQNNKRLLRTRLAFIYSVVDNKFESSMELIPKSLFHVLAVQ